MVEKNLKHFRKNMILENGNSFIPKRAIYYLTLRCNLHCSMCFQNKHNRNEEELSLNEMKKIFESMELSSIHLVGGEIFVRKDIYDIIQYFNTRIENIVLQTNGTLINKRGIAIINSLPNIKEIWISIDGLEKTHELIRGKGTFSKCIEVINGLCSTKNVVINTVVMKENIDELVDMYDYFQKLGVHRIVFQFQMVYSKSNMENTIKKLERLGIKGGMYDDCVRENVNLKYMKKLPMIIDELKGREKNTKINFYPEYFQKNIDAYIEGNILEDKDVFCSDIINSVLKVNPSGKMLVCEALKCKFYDLREISLHEQWNSDEVRKLRKKLTENNLVELCSRCCCLDS